MALRNYSATAAATTIAQGPIANPSRITPTDTTFTVASLSGFPASTPYTIAVGADEEVMLVTAQNTVTNVITVTRHYDGTVATEHMAGAAVKHAVSAIDFREANSYINGPKTWGNLKDGS